MYADESQALIRHNGLLWNVLFRRLLSSGVTKIFSECRACIHPVQGEYEKKAMKLSFQKRAVSSQGSGRFEHSKIDSSLLEDELLVKVRENERLHSEVTALNICSPKR
uniref:Integrase zinc-binding domain-containing protein n=1 Tax=Parascaris equorum TaxID=6256 RepID=A0A914RSC4_PAREQ